MSDAVRVTHYKVVWEAGRSGGTVVLRDDNRAQYDLAVKDSAALAALVGTLRSEPNLTYEPSTSRLYSGDWRSVGWIQGG
jgi:hypothetical protein